MPSAANAYAGDALTPEMFGAKGDGRTNDTQAFKALSEELNARGGGTVLLRPVTYIVGLQRRAAGGKDPSFSPTPIIRLEHCTRAIVIRGNGARLKNAAGLRYGRFDPRTLRPLPNPIEREFGNEALLSRGMVNINHCSGSIEIDNLELDGNLPALVIGGRSAKMSWESGGHGIWLAANSGAVRLSRIHTHHHAADGVIMKPTADRSGSTVATDIVSEYNGRQGCSITGGRNFLFQRCKFQHTGRSTIHHAPGEGVDIEAEIPIRNVAFEDCLFSDNMGFGMGAAPNDSNGISFTRCSFVGTTNWSVGPNCPGIRFRSCIIVGTMGYVHGDADPALAPQFFDCTFTDDPALSPTHQVFLAPAGSKTIALVKNRQNVRFERCRFRLVADGTLPQTGPNVIYENCEMNQRSPQPSTPRGIYLGTSIISGNARLEGSTIRGKVTLNGRLLPAV